MPRAKFTFITCTPAKKIGGPAKVLWRILRSRKLYAHLIPSATRNLALLDLGFLFISSESGRIGFFVIIFNSPDSANPLNLFFTTLSSIEWKEITQILESLFKNGTIFVSPA